MRGDLDSWIVDLLKESEKYSPCMSLIVDDDGHSVELLLDTHASTYSEWIPGEGGDICLIRDQETKRVVGCHLPLMNRKLCVSHSGPIRINSGFLKEDCP